MSGLSIENFSLDDIDIYDSFMPEFNQSGGVSQPKMPEQLNTLENIAVNVNKQKIRTAW